MQRLSKRDTFELLALANAVPTSPAEAMSVEALAAKTELPSSRVRKRRMYGFNVVLAVIAPGVGIYAALPIQRSQWKEALFVCLAIPIIVSLGVLFVRRRANV